MRHIPDNRPAVDDLIAAIPSCRLDDSTRLQQYDRYRQLADTVSSVQRKPEMTVVLFDEHLDPELLGRALVTERECCPFFKFRFEASERRLTIRVRDPEQLPALQALAAAFAPPQAARAESARAR